MEEGASDALSLTSMGEEGALHEHAPSKRRRIFKNREKVGERDVVKETYAHTDTWLNGCYADRDELKALGAQFCLQKKCWYVPRGMNLNVFNRWRSPICQTGEYVLFIPDASTWSRLLDG